MVKRLYSSNAWGYYQLGDNIKLPDIAGQIIDIGFDGFDFLYGEDSFPKTDSGLNLSQITDLKQIVEGKGGVISAVVLVSFELNNADNCIRQLEEGAILANALGTNRINLLPRKKGIVKSAAIKNLEHVWSKKGAEVLSSGLKVSAENHVSTDNEDSDEFLFRTSNDFLEILSILDNQIHIKFDPAWLAMAGDDYLKAFEKCLPFIDLLDVKDYKDGRFVTPGTGIIYFNKLADIMKLNGKFFDIGVEVEEHHFYKPSVHDINKINFLHKSALDFYKLIFDVKNN